MTGARLYRNVGGLALLVLCGCDSARFPVPPPKPPPAVVPAPAAPAPTASALKRISPPPTTKATGKGEGHPPVPARSPILLIGLDENEAQTLLGPPTTIEDQSPGKMWSYRKQECVLSIALYPDVATRVFHILSYKVTSDDHNAGAKDVCRAKFGDVAAAE
ncbi:MAG: hypothetical protein F8N15_07910 [Methanobacterium sp.]|nr:hypothetical protein [Methanobacterium sp.]